MKRILIFVSLLLMLVNVAICEGQESFCIPSFSIPSIHGVNVLTGQELDETEMTHLNEERYQQGENQVGKESVFLAKRDFRIGKVKTISLFDNSSSEIHFFYEPGMTKVCEGSGNTKIYRYTEQNLLYAVEYYRENDLGVLSLLKCERLYWQENHPSPRLITRQLQDADGQTTLCYCFLYNEQGQLVQEKLVGHLSDGSPFLCQIGEDGYPQMEGIDSYGVNYIYSEEDPAQIVAQIEDNGIKTIYEYNANQQCIALFREYQERLILRCFYFYDHQGFLEKAIVDEGSSRDREDLTGVTYQQIMYLEMGKEFPLIGKPLKIENVIVDPQSSKNEMNEGLSFNYNKDGELISAIDSDGIGVLREEDSFNLLSNNSERNFYSLTNSISLGQIWGNVSHFFLSCFDYLQQSSRQTRTKLNAELKLSAPICEALEKFAKTLLGAPTYLLMGFHNEDTRVDSYGEHELSDKVRLTFINGILNTTPMLVESLEDICESHGRVKVHHVYRPTQGWTWDIARAIAIRTAFSLGFRSIHAHLLAQLWKDLIQEMGGVNGGGVIIHYGHSLGGSDTDRARTLLTPEEQKMIRVTTFGSSTLIRNEGFQSVINMISINDGVSSCILEPLGHFRNFFDPESNVRFYNALHKPPYWPTDHMLNGPTYRTLLQELGEEFLKEFSPLLQPTPSG